MIKNYLKIAFRNFMRERFISFVNPKRLTNGVSRRLPILAYIINDLSFDEYNKNANEIYRVTRTFNNTENNAINLTLTTIALPFGPLLQNDFAAIKKITRLLDKEITLLKCSNKLFNELKMFFADEDVFDAYVIKDEPTKIWNNSYFNFSIS